MIAAGPALVEPTDLVDHLLGWDRVQEGAEAAEKLSVGVVRLADQEEHAGVFSALLGPRFGEPREVLDVPRQDHAAVGRRPHEVGFVQRAFRSEFAREGDFESFPATIGGELHIDMVAEQEADREALDRHSSSSHSGSVSQV